MLTARGVSEVNEDMHVIEGSLEHLLVKMSSLFLDLDHMQRPAEGILQ